MFAAVGGGLVVSSDAAATTHNILASESLFRLSFAANLIAGAAYLTLWLLVFGVNVSKWEEMAHEP